ncbi:MAG TPA: hypothetical protein VLS25_01825, partial [Dehalococcoidia bacterium]|nr:hypothetical protein [Dehalococcoidia bacterium]
HRPSPSIVTAEGASPRSLLLSNAWVANGRYSGGGIKSARRARIDDGLLDLVLVEHASPFVRLAALPKLRSGRFVTMRQVEYRQTTGVAFLADPPQPVELDGDVVGTTEATFQIEPARLTVITGGLTDKSRTNEESIGVAGSGSRLG